MVKQSIEDYLEAIYELSQPGSPVHTQEVADRLGVKAPSVTEMFQKLESQDLVKYQKYGGVQLTPSGEEIAKSVRDAHQAIQHLFRLLQVSEHQADIDACKVEHNLSLETVTQLKKFVQFIEGCPKGDPDWLDHFKYFSETGELPDECDQIGGRKH